MSDNPNPRGWSNGSTAVDLDDVQAIGARAVQDQLVVTMVYLRGRDDPMEMRLSQEHHRALVGAFEIYRSGR